MADLRRPVVFGPVDRTSPWWPGDIAEPGAGPLPAVPPIGETVEAVGGIGHVDAQRTRLAAAGEAAGGDKEPGEVGGSGLAAVVADIEREAVIADWAAIIDHPLAALVAGGSNPPTDTLLPGVMVGQLLQRQAQTPVIFGSRPRLLSHMNPSA